MSVNNFFLAQRFAVAGASNDVSKYGYKVLKWYTVHDLPVTPINPVCPLNFTCVCCGVADSAATEQKADTILDIPVSRTLEDLAEPRQTAVSVITPPKVTLGLIDSAEKLGVPSMWLQP